MTTLVTAAAAVIGYVAAILTITAGIDLREAATFHDAPAQVAAFRQALDRGDAAQAHDIHLWFDEHAPSGSQSRSSVSLASGAAAHGEFDLARRSIGDVEPKIAEDVQTLDEESSASWGRALPWLVIGAILTAVVLVLRHRRRAAAADAVEVVTRYVPPRPWWRRPVFLVVNGIGNTLLLAGFLGVVTAVWTLFRAPIPLTVRGLILVGAIIALPAAYFILRYSRPRAARGAAQALRADWRKPVLYLRGFGDDPDAAIVEQLPGAWLTGMVRAQSREEELIGALNSLGPVIAVGRPGERLPHLGAARLYLPGDDWQSGVLRLMELSQFIVLRLGDGEGVWWEVDQARATQPPGKLILLIPSGRPDLAARLDDHLPVPVKLTEYDITSNTWTSAVVAFEQDWTPLIRVVGPIPGERSGPRGTVGFHVGHALQAALQSIGTRRRALDVRTNSQLVATYGKVLLAVPVLALVGYFLRLVFLW